MGVSAERIVFSNPVKNEKDIVWAQENGVFLTTADTLNELLKIKKFGPKMEILWRISIKEENPELLATVFSVKFGDDLSTYEQIYKRFVQIQKMGVDLSGIHFHCGSSAHGSSSF